MSMDALITLIFGDIIAMAITIIIEKSKTVSGKRQKKLWNRLLTFLALMLIALIIIFSISSTNKKQNDFESKINEAQFKLKNFEFIDAAELYSDASLISYNSETFLESKYHVAVCYFLYAATNDSLEYYQNAAEIYKSIINTKEYQNHVRYVDSLSDLASIHLMTEDSWDDSNWRDIIWKLESTLTKEPYKTYYSEEASLKLKVMNTLATYYDYAMASSHSNFGNLGMIQKVLDYGSGFCDVYKQVIATKYSISTFDFDTYYVYRMSKAMLSYVIFSENPTEYCEDIVSMCKTEIERVGISKLPINTLIALKRNISIACIFVSAYDKDNEEENLQQAYNELKPFIGIENQDLREELLPTYSCLIQTKMCSEEDLKVIIDVFEDELSQEKYFDDLSGRATILIWVIENYKDIVEKYSNSLLEKQLFNLANAHLNEAYNLRAFMEEYELERLEVVHQFFD